jgi:hypothetical protein
MRATFTFLVCLLASAYAAAQDVLIKRNGEEINAKVLTITPGEITYLLPNNPQDSLAGPAREQTLARRDVFMIKYGNGVKEVFEDEQTPPVQTVAYEPPGKPIAVPKDNVDLLQKGGADARIYYHGYSGAATGTLIVSLLSPVAGLIPAVACSATPPGEYNMYYPNPELGKDGGYRMGYRRQAHRMKAGRVWRNWGIGLGVNLALIVLLAQ